MNICVFGDSITWGACDYTKGGWVTHLRNHFQEHGNTILGSNGEFVDVAVYNLGISGDTTFGVLEHFETEALVREASIILFAVGINDTKYHTTKDDVFISTAEFAENISELHKRATKIANTVLFVGLSRVIDEKTTAASWGSTNFYCNENIDKYDSILKNFCEKENIAYIDVAGSLTPDDVEDGLHPNTQGHKKIFQQVLPQVLSVMKMSGKINDSID